MLTTWSSSGQPTSLSDKHTGGQLRPSLPCILHIWMQEKANSGQLLASCHLRTGSYSLVLWLWYGCWIVFISCLAAVASSNLNSSRSTNQSACRTTEFGSHNLHHRWSNGQSINHRMLDGRYLSICSSRHQDAFLLYLSFHYEFFMTFLLLSMHSQL